MNPVWIGSPNFTQGREGNTVQKIIIHWMDGTLADADTTFQDTSRATSAHFGIEDTSLHQYVAEVDTAWHAGDFNVNLQSIGIEHSAAPGRDATDQTYDLSIRLCAYLCRRYGLSTNAIEPHNSIIATDCPGTIDISRIRNGVNNNLQGGNEVTTEGLLQSLYRTVLTHPGQPDRALDDAARAYIGQPFDSVYQLVVNSEEAKQARDAWRAAYDQKTALEKQVKELQTQLAHKPNNAADLTTLDNVKKEIDTVEGDLK